MTADPEALRRIVADARERYNAAKAEQFSMGYASVNLGNWVMANLPDVLSALEERALSPACTPEERDVLNALAKCGLPRFDSVYSNISRLPFEPGDDRIKFEIALSEWRATLEETTP